MAIKNSDELQPYEHPLLEALTLSYQWHLDNPEHTAQTDATYLASEDSNYRTGSDGFYLMMRCDGTPGLYLVKTEEYTQLLELPDVVCLGKTPYLTFRASLHDEISAYFDELIKTVFRGPNSTIVSWIGLQNQISDVLPGMGKIDDTVVKLGTEARNWLTYQFHEFDRRESLPKWARVVKCWVSVLNNVNSEGAHSSMILAIVKALKRWCGEDGEDGFDLVDRRLLILALCGQIKNDHSREFILSSLLTDRIWRYALIVSPREPEFESVEACMPPLLDQIKEMGANHELPDLETFSYLRRYGYSGSGETVLKRGFLGLLAKLMPARTLFKLNDNYHERYANFALAAQI